MTHSFPTRRSSDLLFAGGSLIDSKVKDFDGSPLWRGNKLPHINGWKYNLGAQFETDLDARTSAILRIDYSAFGDLYWFVDNLAKQDSVHLLNARLTIEHEPWEFGIQHVRISVTNT